MVSPAPRGPTTAQWGPTVSMEGRYGKWARRLYPNFSCIWNGMVTGLPLCLEWRGDGVASVFGMAWRRGCLRVWNGVGAGLPLYLEWRGDGVTSVFGMAWGWGCLCVWNGMGTGLPPCLEWRGDGVASVFGMAWGQVAYIPILYYTLSGNISNQWAVLVIVVHHSLPPARWWRPTTEPASSLV